MRDIDKTLGQRPLGRLLSLPDVVEQTSLSRPTIYRRIREGTFPRQRHTGGRRVAWTERDIEAWKEALAETVGT